MATKTLLTVEEFLRLPQSKDEWYELEEGELVVVSPGMFRHNHVRDTVFFVLKLFLQDRKLGTVVTEQPFQLFGGTVRIPDVAFVRAERTLPPDTLPEGAPDLVVEVVSPTNTPREIHRRISDYFAAGCKRVWVFYPEEKEIYIHGPGGVTGRRADELLEEPELLPGFSVNVSSFFE